MAKFCNQCGRPLAEGEVCQCQQNNNQQNFNQQNYNQQNFNQQNFNQQMGGQSGSTQSQAEPNNDTVTISTEDWIPLGKLIGIGESDKNDVKGCFERGKKIVPDLIVPCEQEIPVKQYHICNARSRMRGLWQEGRIQVTNKRVLFRLSGRSWIGRVMSHREFTIDEVAGISISNGVRFGLWDFLLGLLISVLAFYIGRWIGAMPAILSYMIGIALVVPFFALKKKFFIKTICLAAGEGAILVSSIRMLLSHPILSRFGLFLGILIFIFFSVALFLYALKPSLSIAVMTKCASDKPIEVLSGQTLVSILEVLPGEDADAAIEEIGTMITDIQKFGDFGIDKWKEA